MEIINSEMLSIPALERCITFGGCDGHGGGFTCGNLTRPPCNLCVVDICRPVCGVQCVCGVARMT